MSNMQMLFLGWCISGLSNQPILYSLAILFVFAVWKLAGLL